MESYKKNLLEKFLAGQCSEEEQREVRVLLNDPEAKDFVRVLMMANANQLENDNYLPSDDLATKTELLKKQLNDRISVAASETGKQRIYKLRNILQYAAIWAGILMVGSFTVWQLTKRSDRQEQVAFIQKKNLQGAPVKYVLPDSTIVFLAAGSKFSYSEDYPKTGRTIQLEGEAFFNVTPNPAKPFIIHTGKVQTRVLGTSFKVLAFKGELVEVAVATGKVGVSTGDGADKKELAKLTPGNKITYNVKTGQALTGHVDVYSLREWTTGELIFDEKPMALVAAELGRRYGVKIAFDNEEIAAHTVSGSFPKQYPVDKTLDLLGDLGDFNYTTSDNKIFRIHKKQGTMQKQ